MPDVQLFDVASFDTVKVANVAVTADTEGAPQTVVTMTTASLPPGTYMLIYAIQATFLAKDRPLHFKLSGTYSDAEFFSSASGLNEALHKNRLYGFPKVHAGGPITMSLECYDEVAEAVIDFADVILQRVA